MIEQIYTFFTIDMIYLWLNIGVIPFWIILLFFPQSKISSFFVSSIFPYFLFGAIYIYLLYYVFIQDYDFLNNFNLYLGIDELSDLFSNSSFLILFWVHFLAINLFCGSWIVKDSQKLNISKIIVFFPLLFTYFIGPVGIFIYWIIRIFFAKRVSLYD
tara:strand:+ start:1144 stop:1617 length:474 start_codon:yes stop_codon:yes gene_type:complete